MRIDLHTHSALSDGTDSVPELIRAAHRAGLDAIALTDHDTMDGVDEAQELGRAAGMEVLRGIEISTHVLVDGVEKSIHLLGYGCSPTHEPLARMLAQVRQSRLDRVPQMVRKLAELGMPVDAGEVARQGVTARSMGRPHIADAMVHLGYVRNRDEAFQRYLDESGPAYVPHHTPELSQAVDTVNEAGGVAVIAHPWGRGSRHLLGPDKLGELASDHGLFGVEVDHVDHDQEDRRALRVLANQLGLVPTGSSDYHGTGKTRNPLGVFCTEPEVYRQITREITTRGGHL